MTFLNENLNKYGTEAASVTEIVPFEEGSNPQQENIEKLNGVVSFIKEKFERAKEKRLQDTGSVKQNIINMFKPRR